MGVRVKFHKGSWWVFITHQGKRRAKKIGDRKAAEQIASELRVRLAKHEFRLPEAGPTFAELARDWCERYPAVRSIRDTTTGNYRSWVDQHLIPYFGQWSVSKITADTIEDFIALKRSARGSVRFAGKPLSPQSLRIGLVALRLILQRAVKAGHLQTNPVTGLARFPRIDDEHVDPFTGLELRAILAAAATVNATFAAMLQLWMQSGMRAGEVSALTRADLDLEQGTVIVQRSWSRQRLGPTKTGRVRRVSFLHPITQDTAEWRPVAREIISAIRRLPVQSPDPTAYLFGRDGSTPLLSQDLHRDWRRVLARRPLPASRATTPYLCQHDAVEERSPALCAATGRMAKRGGPPAGLRAVDSAGLRERTGTASDCNPGATSPTSRRAKCRSSRDF